MDRIDDMSLLKLVRIDTSTSKFKDGIGDGVGLERVSACTGILGAIQGLFFRQELAVEKVMPASLLGLTRRRSRLKPCVVGGGVSNDVASEHGGGKGAVACDVIDALVVKPLSSDSDMRSSSSETFVVVLESVGEEHQELERPTDSLDGAAANSDGREVFTCSKRLALVPRRLRALERSTVVGNDSPAFSSLRFRFSRASRRIRSTFFSLRKPR